MIKSSYKNPTTNIIKKIYLTNPTPVHDNSFQKNSNRGILIKDIYKEHTTNFILNG